MADEYRTLKEIAPPEPTVSLESGEKGDSNFIEIRHASNLRADCGE